MKKTATAPRRTLRDLPRRADLAPLRFAVNAVKENWLRDGAPPPPRAMCFYVTYACNMRCRICGIWRSPAPAPELTPEETARTLADPLFARLEFVNLNGGEPNLRPDLVEIAAVVLDRLPRLETLTINSNGLPESAMLENAGRIARLCRGRGVHFAVSVSLHAPGGTFDAIAGVPGSYDRVTRSIAALRTLREAESFFLSVNCVISQMNLDDLPAMAAWSRRENVPIHFTLGEVRDRFHNEALASNVRVGPEETKKLVVFLEGQARGAGPLNHHAFRYHQLARMAGRRERRRMACHYALGGLILGQEGSLYYCKSSRAIGNARERSAAAIYYDPSNLAYRREELFAGACPRCPPNTFNRIELEKDLFRYLRYLVARR
jgi:MoaA/NifB/PqqE/SkfB family radical SAM enzyme